MFEDYQIVKLIKTCGTEALQAGISLAKLLDVANAFPWEANSTIRELEKVIRVYLNVETQLDLERAGIRTNAYGGELRNLFHVLFEVSGMEETEVKRLLLGRFGINILQVIDFARHAHKKV